MKSGTYIRTEEHKEKQRKLHFPGTKWADAMAENSGKNNYLWKGDNVGYRTLHCWVQRHLGKAQGCSNDPTHKSARFHWANISGEYKRDLSDWKQLCIKCNLNDGIHINQRFYE